MPDYYLMTQDPGFVMRASDKAVFGPLSPDYQAYEADVQAGATVEPFDYVAEAARQAAAEAVYAKLRIDTAAEAVRLKYLEGQPTKTVEYQRAYDAAVSWLADQQQPVPVAVQSWADAKQWTPLQAATDIKAAGDMLNAKLDQIRDVRLKGKEAVAAGAKTAEEVIAELESL